MQGRAVRDATHVWQDAVHAALLDNFNTPGAMGELMGIAADAFAYLKSKPDSANALLLKKGGAHVNFPTPPRSGGRQEITLEKLRTRNPWGGVPARGILAPPAPGRRKTSRLSKAELLKRDLKRAGPSKSPPNGTGRLAVSFRAAGARAT